MTIKDTGGQAFPMPSSETSQGGHFECYGMTLLDWFAGQALATTLEEVGITSHDHNYAASRAYDIAEAMLAEKRKRESA